MMNQDPPIPPDQEAEAKRSFDNFREAIDAGKADGGAKAREKVPDLQEGISNAIQEVVYGSGFAGSFFQELVPKGMREEFARGTDAGRTAGKGACAGFKGSCAGEEESGEESISPYPSFS